MPDGGEAGVFTVTLTPVGHTLTCGPDDTVLAAILRSGASVMFGFSPNTSSLQPSDHSLSCIHERERAARKS